MVVDQTQKVTKTNIEYEKIQQTLPELREQESKTTAELQRNSLILENQETEIHRSNTSADEINIRIEQINDDLNREQFLLDDADENFKRVKDERVSLEKQQGDLFEGQLESSTTSLANDNLIMINLVFKTV